MQCNYRSTYSVFNIRLNVSALQLEICRQFSEPYTETWCQIQRTTYSLRNVDCGPGHIQYIYSSTYTGFNIQLNVAVLLLEIPRQCNMQLHCKLCAKYSAQPPEYAMCTVVPAIYIAITAQHIQDSIYSWTYLRRYWRYIDSSMCVILQPWCQIQGTSCSLRHLECGSGHIQCNYSPTYAGFNIQLNISPPLMEIYRQFNVRYTANMVPNAAHILQFSLSVLSSRTYTI
jgi:hypothetical protein